MKPIYGLVAVLVLTLTFATDAAASQNRGGNTANTQSEQKVYQFRPEDSRILREKYPDWNRIDEHHRGHYAAGDHLSEDWRSRMQPVPIEVIRELVLPPPGHVFGYIDGYCLVYNPDTLVIADAIDLATFESDKNPR